MSVERICPPKQFTAISKAHTARCCLFIEIPLQPNWTKKSGNSILSLMLFEIRRAQNCILDRIQVTPFPHIWPDALFARTSHVFLIKQYTKLANRARSLPHIPNRTVTAGASASPGCRAPAAPATAGHSPGHWPRSRGARPHQAHH